MDNDIIRLARLLDKKYACDVERQLSDLLKEQKRLSHEYSKFQRELKSKTMSLKDVESRISNIGNEKVSYIKELIRIRKRLVNDIERINKVLRENFKNTDIVNRRICKLQGHSFEIREFDYDKICKTCSICGKSFIEEVKIEGYSLMKKRV